MTDVATTIDTYFDMWNETDADKRAELIEAAWTADGRYVDPVQEAEGHAALSEMVAAVHAHYPGQRFRRLSELDLHHDQARFRWHLAAPDGTVTVEGVDIAELTTDGKLRRIAGFFGEVADAA